MHSSSIAGYVVPQVAPSSCLRTAPVEGVRKLGREEENFEERMSRHCHQHRIVRWIASVPLCGAHSSRQNVPTLREAEPGRLWRHVDAMLIRFFSC